ncbi:hypothetical protein KV102_10865 [Mumia sp. zg.B53]|uniref:hypothetical protein n=1 Tax=Mumia sp. zg.B53 TaxID=2855449 RepID=UPI001C6F0A2B|nr:hypothetical protein [Mumia sp. zg.B53]MBW9215342.1 hypothetical protein [Mumia sp. zg.B53]
MSASDLLVPEGARLVHIGPYKTGSTALQSALHQARPVLADHGVRRAGDLRQETLAVLHAVDRIRPYHDAERARRRWERLADEIRTADEARVVVSSEVFSHALPTHIDRVVDALGPGVHVAVTLRPLVSILPSQWQQYVLRTARLPYEEWLRAMFDADARGHYPRGSFWVPHRHDHLVARWAAAVGPERVTVVVLDSSDRRLLPRSFEQMLGLPDGSLVPEEDQENRSLTAAEADLMQAYHRALAQMGIEPRVHYRLLNAGADVYLKQRRPAPDEPKPYTPQWALDAAATVGTEMARSIAGSGVRVVGDLGILGERRTASPPPEVRLSPEAGAQLAAALAAASHNLLQSANRRSSAEIKLLRGAPVTTASLTATTSGVLVRELARRARRRAAAVFGR